MLFVTPAVTHADTFQNLNDVVEWLLSLVNGFILPFLVAVALIAFFWRNIVALAKKDELASKAEMKWYLFWGIIALFAMVSVWGLVGILADIFGIDNAIPQLGTGQDPSTTCDPTANPGEPCDNSNTSQLQPCNQGGNDDPTQSCVLPDGTILGPAFCGRPGTPDC